MKLPLQDEMMEMEGRQLQCMMLIAEQQQKQFQDLKNLITGGIVMTWIILGAVIMIVGW